MPFLSSGIQALPQELKDIIFDYAFNRPLVPNQVVLIDHAYRPPTYLSICSKLRNKSAKHYYSHSIFVFDDPLLGRAWIASVPTVYMKSIEHVDYDPLLPCSTRGHAGWEFVPVCPQGMELMAVEQLMKEYVESRRPREGVLRVKMRLAVKEKEKTFG